MLSLVAARLGRGPVDERIHRSDREKRKLLFRAYDFLLLITTDQHVYLYIAQALEVVVTDGDSVHVPILMDFYTLH
jgi:hypothetical protein